MRSSRKLHVCVGASGRIYISLACALALFEVALFGSYYRPKADFIVAWGVAPGSQGAFDCLAAGQIQRLDSTRS